MPPLFLEPPRRDSSAYRRFKRQILDDRPICEHCNTERSRIVAHIGQPVLGFALIDTGNVLALCMQCDALYTLRNPPLRRRAGKRSL